MTKSTDPIDTRKNRPKETTKGLPTNSLKGESSRSIKRKQSQNRTGNHLAKIQKLSQLSYLLKLQPSPLMPCFLNHLFECKKSNSIHLSLCVFVYLFYII